MARCVLPSKRRERFAGTSGSGMRRRVRTRTGEAVGLLSMTGVDSKGAILVTILYLHSGIEASTIRAIRVLGSTKVRMIVIANSTRRATMTVTGRTNVLTSRGGSIILARRRVRGLSSRRLGGILPGLEIMDHTGPLSGGELMSLSRRVSGIYNVANSNIGSTPTLGRTSVNFTVKSNATITRRTKSIIVLGGDLASVGSYILGDEAVTGSIKGFLVFRLAMGVDALLVGVVTPVLK